MVLWTWTEKNCAQEIQEAGRQTCRFSGIWSFNIVVDLGLFDAQRSIYFFFSGRPPDWIPSKCWADLWGNKKATFCHQNCCEWPIVTSNKPAGSAQLRCFRTSSHKPDRAFPCRDRGVWHVFGDAVFVWLWPIADFTCVVWNTAQSGHGLSKLYEVLVWFEINIHMYQQPSVYRPFSSKFLN